MPYPYSLDLLGTDPNNYITNELHATDETYVKHRYFIIPELCPFYKDDFSITLHYNNNTIALVENVDFIFVLPYLAGKRHTNREVYGGIILLNQPLSSIVSINYRFLGGSKVADRNSVINKLIDYEYNEKMTLWEFVSDVPDVLLPKPSFNEYPNTKGYLEVNEKNYGIRDALALGYKNISESLRTIFRNKYKYNPNPINYNDYLNIYGDTVNTTVKLNSNPINLSDAFNKAFLENKINQTLLPIDESNLPLANKLLRSNPVATGPLYSNATITPTQPYSLVTKQMVDDRLALLTGGTKIKVGEVALFPSDSSIPKFIKADGRVIDKTAYSSLYSIIGNKYNRLETIGHGRPWQYREKIPVNSLWQSDLNFQYIMGSNLSIDISTILTNHPNISSAKAFVVGTNVYLAIISYYDPVGNTGTNDFKIYKATFNPTTGVINGFTLYLTPNVQGNFISFNYNVNNLKIVTAFNKVYIFIKDQSNTDIHIVTFDFDNVNFDLTNDMYYEFDTGLQGIYIEKLIDVFLVDDRFYLVSLLNSPSKIAICHILVNKTNGQPSTTLIEDDILNTNVGQNDPRVVTFIHDKHFYYIVDYINGSNVYIADINADNSLSPFRFIQNLDYIFKDCYVDVCEDFVTIAGWIYDRQTAIEDFNQKTFYVNVDKTLRQNNATDYDIDQSLDFTYVSLNDPFKTHADTFTHLLINRQAYYFSFGYNKYIKYTDSNLGPMGVSYYDYQNQPIDFTLTTKFTLPYLENKKLNDMGLSYFICYSES